MKSYSSKKIKKKKKAFLQIPLTRAKRCDAERKVLLRKFSAAEGNSGALGETLAGALAARSEAAAEETTKRRPWCAQTR